MDNPPMLYELAVSAPNRSVGSAIGEDCRRCEYMHAQVSCDLALLKGALIVSDSIHHLQITHCASSCAKAES